jgi:hypothetical protein
MPQTAITTQVDRRAELVEQILDILEPQLNRQPVVTTAQHVALHAAIAGFAEGRDE